MFNGKHFPEILFRFVLTLFQHIPLLYPFKKDEYSIKYVEILPPNKDVLVRCRCILRALCVSSQPSDTNSYSVIIVIAIEYYMQIASIINIYVLWCSAMHKQSG